MHSLVFSKQPGCVPTHTYKHTCTHTHTYISTHKGQLLPRVPQTATVIKRPNLMTNPPCSIFSSFFNLPSLYLPITLSALLISTITHLNQMAQYHLLCWSTLSNWLSYNLINAAECHRGFLSSREKVSVSALCKYHHNVAPAGPPLCQAFTVESMYTVADICALLQGNRDVNTIWWFLPEKKWVGYCK